MITLRPALATHHEDVGDHATLKGYVTGFLLAVLLTAIPFWLVMAKVLPPEASKFVVACFAAVQVLVHMVFFLHLGRKTEGGWSVLATVFTLMVVAIMLAGSLWVMHNMNANMMPVDPQAMRNMP